MSEVTQDQEGARETFGDITVAHHFKELDGPVEPVLWHYVEAGQAGGDPIVFLHGNGQSWFCWHPMIAQFGTRCRIIAPDLKGFGQSDKRDGSYKWETVAEETLALLDALGVVQFTLVAHDEGSILGDYIAGKHPLRIARYIRMSQPVHVLDPAVTDYAKELADPVKGPQLMSDYFELRMRKLLRKKPKKEIKERIVRELSYPGIAEAVPRYYRSSRVDQQMNDRLTRLLKRMNFPVLLIQGDADPLQPAYYFGDPRNPATAHFPNAKLAWIKGGGHFITIDNPREIIRHMTDFMPRD